MCPSIERERARICICTRVDIIELCAMRRPTERYAPRPDAGLGSRCISGCILGSCVVVCDSVLLIGFCLVIRLARSQVAIVTTCAAL